MDIEDVRERIEEIKKVLWDDEVAHGREDSLYFDLLKSIADGSCADPRACASEAITTNDLDFSRWYA